MARRLILDTNALIAYERGAFDTVELDEDDLAIAPITVAEFRVGIELARTTAQAARRSRVLAVILDSVGVLDYTERTAVEHARLLAHVRRAGAPCGAHDLIIAAHALEHGRAIFSPNAKARFGDLPGVGIASSGGSSGGGHRVAASLRTTAVTRCAPLHHP